MLGPLLIAALLSSLVSYGGSVRPFEFEKRHHHHHHTTPASSKSSPPFLPPSPPPPPPVPDADWRTTFVATDPCVIGPSYWCLKDENPVTKNNVYKCNLDGIESITPCGFSSSKCTSTKPDISSFCNMPNSRSYDGGIVGLPAGFTTSYTFAWYWAPSSCQPDPPKSPRKSFYDELKGGKGVREFATEVLTYEETGFCSAFTRRGTYASRTLQVHGLWPNFGYLPVETRQSDTSQVLSSAQRDANDYQGWSQYCLKGDWPDAVDHSQCHVNGNLCPEKVEHQFEYEICMRRYNVSDCTISEEILSSLSPLFEKYGAGYLGEDKTFIDHEWNKHGSCMPGFLGRDKRTYFSTIMSLAGRFNAPETSKEYFMGSVNDFLASHRGGSVSPEELRARLGDKGVPKCNSKCQLSELWYCMGRDMAGNPSHLVPCPLPTLLSDSCSPVSENAGVGTRNCVQIFIPDYDSQFDGSKFVF